MPERDSSAPRRAPRLARAALGCVLAAVPMAVVEHWRADPVPSVQADASSVLGRGLTPQEPSPAALDAPLSAAPMPAATTADGRRGARLGSALATPGSIAPVAAARPARTVVPATTPATPAAPSMPSTPSITGNLAYGNLSSRQVLDLYRPASPTPPPLVVYVHGGGWVGGDKADTDELTVINVLVERGYAVASINYRLADEGIFPTQLDDTATAVGWLRANARALGVDADRLALFGVSAGAQLAVLLGVSHRIDGLRAIIDWEGPTELAAVGLDLGRETRCAGAYTSPDDPESFWAAYVGGPVSTVPERVAETDPRRYLAPGETGLPRFLVAHGDNDCTVPLHQSERFVEALQATGQGSLVTFRVLPGAGHGSQFPIASEAQEAGAFLASAFA